MYEDSKPGIATSASARAVLLAAALCAVLALGATGEGQVYVVTANEPVRVLLGPGTEFRLVDVLQPGQTVRVCGMQGEWVEVCPENGRDGFVHSRWLAPLRQDQAETVRDLMDEVDRQRADDAAGRTEAAERELVPPPPGDESAARPAANMVELTRTAQGHEDPGARLAATRDLIALGESAVPVLLNLLTTGDQTVRVEAASGLGEIGGERAVQGLIDAVADPGTPDPVKIASTEGFIRQNASGALPLLEQERDRTTNDAYRAVLSRAIAQLGR